MISKYAYKNLTWLDLYCPSHDELEHILEQYPDKHLHFVIGDDFLITTRKQESTAIQDFAKSFENNVMLDRPDQTQSIDSLFFDLVSLFNKHSDNKEITNNLAEKTETLSALEYTYKKDVQKYKQKINYYKGMLWVVSIISIIIILILWL